MKLFLSKTSIWRWTQTALVLLSIVSIFHSAAAEEFISAVTHWPPRIIADPESGSTSGIDIEFIGEVLEKAGGFRLKPKIYPFKRCLKMLERGDSDLVFAILRHPEREAYLHFIEPPYFTRSFKVFYVRKGEGHRLRKYEDLYNMNIGTISGFKYFPRFDADDKLRKHIADMRIPLFKMLLKGRIGTFIETEIVGDYLINKEGFSGKFQKAPFRYEGKNLVYMAVSKKSRLAEHVPRLNQVMTQMVKEGRFEKIKDMYLNP